MPRAIIFANGSLEKPPELAGLLRETALIIAADGGTHHCTALGIQPSAIIGDLDSIDSREEQFYQSKGTTLIRYPSHKDETDLELAIQYAARNAMDEVIILGALGARWDMTFANVFLAALPQFAKLKIRFLDGSQELVLIRPGEHMQFYAHPGDRLSLIPIHGEAHGVATHGLEYPLLDDTLHFASPRGVSNVFIQAIAEVSIKKGLLLCMIDRRSS